MIRCGITEKRLKNRRFKRTEEKILEAYFEGECTLCGFAKKIGVARTTVYFHHHRIASIPVDYQYYILYIYKKALVRIEKSSDLKIESVFEITLFFILQNKELFRVALKTGNTLVYRKMMIMLQPLIIKAIRLPKNSKRMFNVYVVSVVELLDEWGKSEFKEAEMKELLKNILFLTKTFRTSLAPIMDN